jgi:secreted trypsin-like serine protease
MRLIARMLRRLALLALALACPPPALAMVGGAPVAAAPLAPHVVLIIGSGGTSCTGSAIARDLVLTAAHCALPGADYKLVEFDAQRQPTFRDVAQVARHPGFDLRTLLGHHATADVALLKLTAPLAGTFVPAALASPRLVAVGDSLVVVGYGVTVRGDGRTGGTMRTASLAVTGQPGSLQIRLVDPTTANQRAGLGACTGDSGAPVFDPSDGRTGIIGVVSWSTGPHDAAGCGGLTGVTPLAGYRDWILQQAARMGSALAP